LSEALARHGASGKRLLDLTASNPTECGFEYDGEVILAALGIRRRCAMSRIRKGLRARDWRLRNIIRRLARVSADDIFLTTSTSEALFVCVSTCCAILAMNC